MKFQALATIGLVLATSACTMIPTNGNDTSFTRTGSLDCPPELQINPDLLQGSQGAPLRCGPQVQPVTP